MKENENEEFDIPEDYRKRNPIKAEDIDTMFKEEKKPKEKKAEQKQEQELDIYWKLNGKGKAKLAIKLTKGKRITVILKDPKYLKELRSHLQTVAKFGLRKNFI